MKTPTPIKTAEPSTAIRFIQFVWDHRQEAISHSWLKMNHSLREALSLAVTSGMSFNPEDIEVLFRQFRAGYWMGADTEWFYSLAVLYRHPQAYHAYEVYANRKPFIVRTASIHTHTGDGPAGGGLARLVVGAEFRWNGERVKVTSFNDDKACVCCCTYANDGDYPRKISKRYSIAHADIKAARKAA